MKSRLIFILPLIGFAVLAVVGARKQDRAQIIPRWQLLWPGVAALLAYLSMMLFPSPRDALGRKATPSAPPKAVRTSGRVA